MRNWRTVEKQKGIKISLAKFYFGKFMLLVGLGPKDFKEIYK